MNVQVKNKINLAKIDYNTSVYNNNNCKYASCSFNQPRINQLNTHVNNKTF